MTKWYTLDITCAACQGKGKLTTVGTLLAPAPIDEKALDDFLAKQNNAVFICNECSEIMDRNASHITGTKK
jgi:hypothetical protein